MTSGFVTSSACKFRGPPAWFEIYMRRECFEPAFRTSSNYCNTPEYPQLPPQQASGFVQYKYDNFTPKSNQLYRDAQSCGYCVQNVFQCDRFPWNSPEAEKCRKASTCFVHNAPQNDNTLIPLSVKNTPECQQVAKEAYRLCPNKCLS